MKKKKIIILVMLLLTCSCIFIPSIYAFTEGSNAGQAHVDPVACDGGWCYRTVMPYGDPSKKAMEEINGFRASIVDKDGKRVSGTVSVDFISNANLVAGNPGKLEKTHLAYNNAQGYLHVTDGKPTRNEVLDGLEKNGYKIGYVTDPKTEIEVYYWPDFPKFVTGNEQVKPYILGLYNTDRNTFNKFFELLNYDPTKYINVYKEVVNESTGAYEYTDQLKTMDTYLLIEPLSYLRAKYGDTIRGVFYGTSTEVLAVSTRTMPEPAVPGWNEPIPRFGSWSWDHACLLHVEDRNELGGTYKHTAQLAAIELSECTVGGGRNLGYRMLETGTVSADGVKTLGLGVASAHFWVFDMVSDCIGDCCPSDPDYPYCGTKKKGDPCTEPSVFLPSTCEGSSVGYVKDSENWKCIYDQIKADKNTYTGKYYNTIEKNRYCTVACREEIEFNFPRGEITSNEDDSAAYKTILTVPSGYRFSINSPESTKGLFVLSPVSFTGISTCQTGYPEGSNPSTDSDLLSKTKIDYAKFANEYKDADYAVVAAWDLYQIEVAKKAAIDAVNEKRNSSGTYNSGTVQNDTVCSTTTKGYKHYTITGTKSGGKCVYDADATPVTDGKVHENAPICGPEDTNGCIRCIRTEEVTESTTHTMYKFHEERVYNNETYSADATLASCGTHGSKAADNAEALAAAKTAYENAVAYRDGLYNEILWCNNFQRQYDEFAPAVSFGYSDSAYKYGAELDSDLNMSVHTVYYSGNYSSHTKIGEKDWNERSIGFIYSSDLSGLGSNVGSVKKSDCKNDGTPCTNTCKREDFKTEAEYNQCLNNVQDWYWISYPKGEFIVQTTKKTYNYKLPDNVYRYVSKIDGTAYNSEEELELSTSGTSSENDKWYTGVEYLVEEGGTGKGYYKKYKYLDYSSLPISFGTRQGTYDYVIEYVYLPDGTKNLFGQNQKYYNEIQVGEMTTFQGNLIVSNTNRYICQYKVVEKDFCKGCCPDDPKYPYCDDPCPCKDNEGNCIPCPDDGPGGITVIYRPISLYNPFPSITGNGRSPGANWLGPESDTMQLVREYITNNRGVETYDVYRMKPMYEFILSPINMRRIRAYNDTKLGNYNDFDLVCKDNRYCKSKFLYEGKNLGYFKFTLNNDDGGTCFNATVSNWDSCRYNTTEY